MQVCVCVYKADYLEVLSEDDERNEHGAGLEEIRRNVVACQVMPSEMVVHDGEHAV